MCDNFLYSFKGALTRARAGRSGLDKGTLAAGHLGLLRAGQRAARSLDSLRPAAPCQARCSVRAKVAAFGRALGRGADHRRGGEWTSGKPAAEGRGEGALAVVGRQLGPLPLARQRTGAGRCRQAVSPAPARWRSPPSRTPVGAPARTGRVVFPCWASCRALDSELPRHGPAPTGRATQCEALLI